MKDLVAYKKLKIQELETKLLDLCEQYSESTDPIVRRKINNKIISAYLEMKHNTNDLLKITNYARNN
jgi:hypothetical protein